MSQVSLRESRSHLAIRGSAKGQRLPVGGGNAAWAFLTQGNCSWRGGSGGEWWGRGWKSVMSGVPLQGNGTLSWRHRENIERYEAEWDIITFYTKITLCDTEMAGWEQGDRVGARRPAGRPFQGPGASWGSPSPALSSLSPPSWSGGLHPPGRGGSIVSWRCTLRPCPQIRAAFT